MLSLFYIFQSYIDGSMVYIQYLQVQCDRSCHVLTRCQVHATLFEYFWVIQLNLARIRTLSFQFEPQVYWTSIGAKRGINQIRPGGLHSHSRPNFGLGPSIGPPTEFSPTMLDRLDRPYFRPLFKTEKKCPNQD